MTERPRDPLGDPFDLLQAHVRALALLEQPATDADDLVADITGGIDRTDRSRGAQVLPLHGTGSPRRRRWLVAGVTAATVAVGAAGVAAYVSSKPADPVAGIVCRESADFGSTSVVLPLDDDPIAACANLWKTGDLPKLDQESAGGDVPSLIACTGGTGAIEVLPVDAKQTCTDLGLVDADIDGASSDPVAELRERLVDTVNMQRCQSPAQVERAVETELARLRLTGWSVEVVSPDAECAAASIDLGVRRVYVVENPVLNPSTQEKP